MNNTATPSANRFRFRGLCTSGKAWYVGLLSISHGHRPEQPKAGYYISNRCGMPWAYEVRPETVGLFIGDTDKKGKEMFEGDIVRVYDANEQDDLVCTQVVKWKNGYFCEWDNGNFCPALGDGDEVVCEVIGNIYENPELLR